MGGKLFEGTSNITRSEWNANKNKLYAFLTIAGCTKIEPIGSIGIADESGDIDLAVEIEPTLNLDNLVKILNAAFCHVKNVGKHIISFRWPCEQKFVQVDLIVNCNVSYMAWAARSSQDDVRLGIKNNARIVLFNSILKVVSAEHFKNDQSSDVLVKYTLDSLKGLNVVKQTFLGAKAQALKMPKTLNREFLTDVRLKILSLMFGDNHINFLLQRSSTFAGTLSLVLDATNGFTTQQKNDIFVTCLDVIKTSSSDFGNVVVIKKLLLDAINDIKNGKKR